MEAADQQRTTRQRAIEGLCAIAQLEEYVAAEIDEPGYYGRLAEALRGSAEDRRLAAARLELAEPQRPQLRVVT